MSNDCWANRKSGMKCATCVFFVEKKHAVRDVDIAEIPIPIPTEDSRGAIGRCRRNAPTMKGFPIVFEQDWCGEHRIDENKI